MKWRRSSSLSWFTKREFWFFPKSINPKHFKNLGRPCPSGFAHLDHGFIWASSIWTHIFPDEYGLSILVRINLDMGYPWTVSPFDIPKGTSRNFITSNNKFFNMQKKISKFQSKILYLKFYYLKFQIRSFTFLFTFWSIQLHIVFMFLNIFFIILILKFVNLINISTFFYKFKFYT